MCVPWRWTLDRGRNIWSKRFSPRVIICAIDTDCRFLTALARLPPKSHWLGSTSLELDLGMLWNRSSEASKTINPRISLRADTTWPIKESISELQARTLVFLARRLGRTYRLEQPSNERWSNTAVLSLTVKENITEANYLIITSLSTDGINRMR